MPRPWMSHCRAKGLSACRGCRGRCGQRPWSPTADRRASPGSMPEPSRPARSSILAPSPNGVAIVAHRSLAIVACIGDESHPPTLHVVDLRSRQRWATTLPGRPRWCVTDAAGTRVFLALRDPSMVLRRGCPNSTTCSTGRFPPPAHTGSISTIKRTRSTLPVTTRARGNRCGAREIRVTGRSMPSGRDLLHSGQRVGACRERQAAGPSPSTRHRVDKRDGRMADGAHMTLFGCSPLPPCWFSTRWRIEAGGSILAFADACALGSVISASPRARGPAAWSRRCGTLVAVRRWWSVAGG